MACLGVEPGAAWWKAQTNPLSYGGTPKVGDCYLFIFSLNGTGDGGTSFYSLDLLAEVNKNWRSLWRSTVALFRALIIIQAEQNNDCIMFISLESKWNWDIPKS